MKRSKPNSRIAVIYGEHKITEERPGLGYTYISEESVAIGDIVKVPPTAIDRKRGLREQRTATVVSLEGDYDGYVDYTIGTVRNSNPMGDAIDAIENMERPDEPTKYGTRPIGLDMIDVTVNGESIGMVDSGAEPIINFLVDRLNEAEEERYETQYRQRESNIVTLLNSTVRKQ